MGLFCNFVELFAGFLQGFDFVRRIPELFEIQNAVFGMAFIAGATLCLNAVVEH